MKSTIKLFLAVVFVVMFVPSAHAQSDNGGYTGPDMQSGSEPCAGTMDPDTCMFADSSKSWGGQYYYCSAQWSKGGTCADVQYKNGGVPTCVNVTYQAHCACDTAKNPPTYGMCTIVR
jgi:hypothetical protein